MHTFHQLVQSRCSGARVLAVALFGVMLLGCAHHAPAVLHQNVAVISGKGTAGYNAADAERKILIEAAAITVDHGYRYFEIVAGDVRSNSALLIRPGADVTIKLFGAGEVDPHAAGVWDALAIGAGQLP
jgi:hypothetical protein